MVGWDWLVTKSERVPDLDKLFAVLLFKIELHSQLDGWLVGSLGWLVAY